MAPDAPTPHYNSLGDLMEEWEARLRYDEVDDVLVLHWRSKGGRWRSGQTLRLPFAVDDVEGALGQLSRLVRTASVRRLF